ncbi:MAG: hybrid sensor histidine kinase/response regulator [Gammaproteobacteria bacterium]|nr:hybrid sensor histidine kinase/response regulator [Gammaproteobacteria bacterium]
MLLHSDYPDHAVWLLITALIALSAFWLSAWRGLRTDRGSCAGKSAGTSAGTSAASPLSLNLHSGAAALWRRIQAAVASRRAALPAHSANELLASLAHDLRSPMQGILGGAEQLARDERDPDRHRILDEIRRTALHLIHIAEDSLEIARLNHRQAASESRPFRLETVLADILATARPLRAAGVELAVDLTRLQHGEFKGEPDRLRQILANVVNNSLARTRSGHVLLSARSTPRKLVIEIQDTGPGIPLRQRFKLMSAFTQGRNATGRAGMGLAIAERLATALGGRLMLLSQSGEGCRFRLQLPFPALPEPRPKGEASLLLGFADASTLERQILLRHTASWNMKVHEFDTREDLAGWLGQPTGLDALIVSQGWLGQDPMSADLRAHCRQQHIALVVLADDEPHAAAGQGQVPADIWPRPLLPSELLTALELRPVASRKDDEVAPRVLVVDDHPLVRKLLAEAVHRLGAQPILAESGVAAVRAAGLGASIDIVLLDRNMPGLDGIHAARILRRQPATEGAMLILMVNDEADARAADPTAFDHVFIRPQGLEAIERGLGALFRAGATSTKPALPARAPPSRLLEDSLLEDLETLARHLDAGDRDSVSNQIHRIRGALRVFPSPRHQAWLEALARANRDWHGALPPPGLHRAVLEARRILAH